MPTADAVVATLCQALDPDQVLAGLADRVAWANDASLYRLVPRVVVFPRTPDQVAAVLRIADAAGVPVCFRAGGTSVSGQAITDGILVVVSRHLRGIQILNDGRLVRCGPGAVGSWVNAALKPHGRRIGPDPASIQAAEIGGIVANNSSGMCCGVHENSYRTVTGLDLLLADGARIDTGADDAEAQLRRSRPALADGLLALRDRVRADPALVERIRTAFATKNTVGYSLNAFLDADTPAAMLQRLVIGSEGTLAFIASATFATVPLAAVSATAWLVFAEIESACAAVAGIAATGAAAIELLDHVSLARVAAKLPEPLPPGEPAALLVEYQADDDATLHAVLSRAGATLSACDLVSPAQISRDPARQAQLWAVRKGLFPSVGAIRALGTAVVVEDITFPVARLAQGVRELRALFDLHGYADAVIFGHAKDGNLHFTLTPDLSQPAEVARYDGFLRAMVDLVLGHGGHLKAEHGTGRNMAPWVTAQWGGDAVAIMRSLKALLDPQGILNPGVLLSDDPQAHLADLKRMPAADPLVDRCIECGFCEPVCPSRDATRSPRQRIVQLRAIALGGAAAQATRAVLRHDVVDTCAADGMCATACPVGIDTGAIARAHRAASHGWLGNVVARMAATRFDLTVAGARGVLSVIGGRRLPRTRIPLPRVANALPRSWPVAEPGAPTIAYLPSCVSRLFGDDPVVDDLAQLCAWAGVGLVVPSSVDRLCCGQAFASKGFPEQARQLSERTIRALLALPADGVLIDTGTCAGYLESVQLPEPLHPAWRAVRRWHPANFLSEVLAPRLRARGRWPTSDARWSLHPTCGEVKAGWSGDLSQAVAGLAEAHVPLGHGCCGAAGDLLWREPAVTAAATRREAASISGATLGVSTNPACNLALSSATGVRHGHLFSVVTAACRGSV